MPGTVPEFVTRISHSRERVAQAPAGVVAFRMRHSRLARCPVDGVPLVLVVSAPHSFMEAVRASQDARWGSVVVQCPLCDRAVDPHDTARGR